MLTIIFVNLYEKERKERDGMAGKKTPLKLVSDYTASVIILWL